MADLKSDDNSDVFSRLIHVSRLGIAFFSDLFNFIFRQPLRYTQTLDPKNASTTEAEWAQLKLRTRTEILSELSYEVRTPLSGLLGTLQLVLDTELTEDQRKYLQASFSSSQLLLQVLNLSIHEKKTAAPAIPVQGSVAPEHFSTHAMRILVVEDNVINQMVAVAILKKQGHLVEATVDGREAIRMVQNGSYDLILMDCQMPIMSGYQVTQLIRTQPDQSYPEIPIVAMTANAMRGDADRCLDVGMDDYLAKPVDAEKLATVVRKWLAVGEQRKRKYAKQVS